MVQMGSSSLLKGHESKRLEIIGLNKDMAFETAWTTI